MLNEYRAEIVFSHDLYYESSLIFNELPSYPVLKFNISSSFLCPLESYFSFSESMSYLNLFEPTF